MPRSLIERASSVNCLSQGHSRTKARVIVNLVCARFPRLALVARFPGHLFQVLQLTRLSVFSAGLYSELCIALFLFIMFNSQM